MCFSDNLASLHFYGKTNMSKCNVLERMEFLQHVFKVKLKERNSTQIGTQWINVDILIYSIILKCTEINSIICLFPLINTGYVVILYLCISV